MARILIVDDDPNSYAALRLLLRMHGHTTVHAADGTSGLALAESCPDLIFLDVNLPDMLGHDVVRRLRARAATRAIPVIILTSNTPNTEARIEGLQGGADMYLHRPVDNRELLGCVSTLLRAKDARDQVLAQNQRLKRLVEWTRLISSSEGLEQVGERLAEAARDLLQAAAAEVLLEGSEATAGVICGTSRRETGFDLRDSRQTWMQPMVRLREAPQLMPLEAVKDDEGTTCGRAVELHLPLFSRGARLGMLSIRIDPPRPLLDDELSLAETLARHGATVIDNDALLGERNQMRAQLVHSDKLATLGVLVAGVAHELNNPLAGIMGFCELLLDGYRRGLPMNNIEGDLELVYKQAQRAATVVSGLLRFARKSRPQKSPTDLRAALHEILEMRSYSLASCGVQLVLDLCEEPLEVNAIGDQIQQVFLNLVVNAQQAVSLHRADGSITVSCAADWSVQPAEAVFEFSDNGPGIPRERVQRIFEPFFTTKEEGVGTGLGLYIARGIVRDHHGTLHLESKVGEGTRFTVRLPLHRAHAAATVQPLLPPSPGVSPMPPSPSGFRVLVVDDEPMVLEAMRRMVRNLGHQVETVDAGKRALEMIESNVYDMVFTDLKMPGFGGRALYEAIRERQPLLAERVVFVSGDSASPGTQDFLGSTGAPFLPKPFTTEQVHRVIEVLRARNQSEIPRV